MTIHVFVSFVVVTSPTPGLRVRSKASRAQAREALSDAARLFRLRFGGEASGLFGVRPADTGQVHDEECEGGQRDVA
ncbi:hypothetical protein, partial [Streptomyces cinereoruber]|uniref:hypothetical protein n=1 Tax=Streptomyces cinereoruber TaxID=67260 RepID=UPI0036252E62